MSKPKASQGDLGAWSLVTATLGVALIAGGLYFRATEALPRSQRAAIPQTIVTGVALAALALAVLAARRRLAAWIDGAEAERTRARRYATLFVASFVALFVEIVLIRYCGSQIRVFSFYKNVPLVSCFLGLGLGCCLGRGRSRHALAFLLWLVPLAAFLAQGALLVDGYLAKWTARGNVEHVLGDEVPAPDAAGGEWSSQLFMGLFCVATLVAVTLLFTFLGRLLGGAFEGIPRLPAYTVNILGSLAGIAGFVALSYLQTSPWLWLTVGLGPLLWWIPSGSRAALAGLLIALNVAAVAPSYGETVWSPYQKLVGHEIPAGAGGSGTDRPAYLVQISDVFYQIAVDLRPEAIAQLGRNPFPHYDGAYRGLPRPGRVLVVGSGTGNDVAAALRAGAERVDAVEIDPAIVAMGRRHHPEAPYADERVRVVVDDARRAFRYLEPASYDAVVFGLLDSHTQLGMSSVRLDNYVFTRESFSSAVRLLKPGGHIIVTAATFRDWFRDRLVGLVRESCDSTIEATSYGVWWSYTCRVEEPPPEPAANPETMALPSDDWPFLYLPERGVPRMYLIVLAMLALASVAILKLRGLELGRFTAYHGHLFFLGAAFLLMEVYAINRMALLFGTTWLVSAVTIALVLTLIVAGNLVVGWWSTLPYPLAYAGLVASLAVSYFIEPADVLGRGTGAALGYGLLLVSPVFFAALVFARSFRRARQAGPAIGFNILGSVVGGWAEYSTMATGIRAMVLLALAFYLLSLLALLRFEGETHLSSD